jgi:4-hydroxybenzoate polyprenyltransferase
MFLLARAFALGPVALAGMCVVALLLAYEHSIISPRDIRRMNAAFFTLNGIISVVFFLAVAGSVFLHR